MCLNTGLSVPTSSFPLPSPKGVPLKLSHLLLPSRILVLLSKPPMVGLLDSHSYGMSCTVCLWCICGPPQPEVAVAITTRYTGQALPQQSLCWPGWLQALLRIPWQHHILAGMADLRRGLQAVEGCQKTHWSNGKQGRARHTWRVGKDKKDRRENSTVNKKTWAIAKSRRCKSCS